MRLTVHEFTGLGRSRIDEANGIIFGVKVIGFKSKNKRHYPKNLLRKKYTIYEGSQVYIDHDLSGNARPLKELGGTLRELKFRPDGVYANLHYLKSTPAGKQVLEVAKHHYNKCGLSPHHDIEVVKRPDGWVDVKDIHGVTSVDLVTDPATNKNLFEATMADEAPATISCEEALGELVKSLMAEGKDEFVKDVIKLKNKILGSNEEEESPDETPAGDGEGDETPADEATHVDTERIAKLETRLVCAESAFAASEAQITELLPLDDAARKSKIKAWKTAARGKTSAMNTPRSAPQKQTATESANDGIPDINDRDKFAAWLQG